MPRNISASALALLTRHVGIEPINIVQVQWTPNGPMHYYSDRKYAETEGKLISISDLEGVINVDKSSSSTSISIELDDTDGVIKNIYNYNDLHSRPVKVFQWFTEIPFNDKFLIFEGHIASPIMWDEGKRTLRFDVLTKIANVEVGFSVEEGQIVGVPNTLIGKAWPLVFGTVYNVPTVQMDDIPTGSTLVPVGIPDPTRKHQIGFLNAQVGEQIARANCMSDRGAQFRLEGDFNNNKQLYERGQALQRQADDLIKQASHTLRQDLARLNQVERDVSKYDVTSIPILNGHRFHQGNEIAIEINGAQYVGSFQGDTFNVTYRRGPQEVLHRQPGTAQGVRGLKYEFDIIGDTQEEEDKRFANFIFGTDMVEIMPSSITEVEGDPCAPPWLLIFKSAASTDGARQQRESKDFFAPAGTAVTVFDGYYLRYIISIIPGIQVLALSARGNSNGVRVIQEIPPWYYELGTLNLGGIVATIATFYRPLSAIDKSVSWENNVYATVVSPVGPNVVDILIYLIQTYTSFGIDYESFNYVRAKLDNYPANFALTNRPNITSLLKDIAYQARCSIWVSNDTFFIKYLPEEGVPIDTINENYVLPGTLRVDCTQTEDLVTKLNAKWRFDYSLQEQNTVVLRYNIPKYGLNEETYDFFIYNDVSLVVKSATFWMIRKSNIWKRVLCKVTMDKLKIETLDSVTVNFAHNYVADVSFTAIVEKASFNSSDWTVELELWCPVRLGEMMPYIFAYPANVDTQLVYPEIEDQAATNLQENEDIQGDLGGQFNVTVNHYKGGTIWVKPSDGNDTKPNPLAGTTINGYLSGTGLDTGPVSNPTGISPQTAGSQRPATDVQYTNPSQTMVNSKAGGQNVQQYLPNQVMPRVYPGKVIGKAGDNVYNVRVYPCGPENEDQSNQVTTIQLQIDSASEIKADTWGIVIFQVWYEDNQPKTKYSMQIPVWEA